MESSTSSWEVKIASRLMVQLRKLDAGNRRSVEKALVLVGNVWGNPHRHAGAGIRKLTPRLFECRAGLKLRLLFIPDASRRELVFVYIGNHDEVSRQLRNF
jgi:mRNA-degrading endonuclease RelE of RelBE toxin-antitoxin system